MMQIFGPDAQSEDERRLFLRTMGPRIDAYLSNPMNIVSAKRSKRISALIDTGASMNMIDNRLAVSLNLLQLDNRHVGHAMGRSIAPVYYAKLFLPKIEETIVGRFYGGDTGGMNSSYDMLLGRSFLSRFIFNYDGLRGHFGLASVDDLPGIVRP